MSLRDLRERYGPWGKRCQVEGCWHKERFHHEGLTNYSSPEGKPYCARCVSLGKGDMSFHKFQASVNR